MVLVVQAAIFVAGPAFFNGLPQTDLLDITPARIDAVGTQDAATTTPVTCTKRGQTGGKDKKIISFSLFSGKFREPLPQWLDKGVFANIEGYHFYFPGWIVRIYIANVDTMPLDFMERLRTFRIPVEIVELEDWGRPDANMIQRFLPLDDPDVSVFMVRDLDSRPSIRELLAVNEWLSSPRGETFHVMKDHPFHTVAVMGGTWAAKRGALQNIRLNDLIQKFRKEGNRKAGGNGLDQDFLAQVLWPIVKGNALVHDSQRCKQSGNGNFACRPYPFSLGWDDFHIGHPFKYDDETGRSFLFDQYHCFSTCHMAELECTCKAKSYKMHHKRDVVLGPNDWQMQKGPEYPADIKRAVSEGTLSNHSICPWDDKSDEYDCSKTKLHA